jgi:small-conductance mechanosensitive channel
MLEGFLGELTLRHILVSISVFLAFIVLAWLFRVFLARVAHRLAREMATGLDDAVIGALGKPIIAIIVLAGLYLSGLSLPLEPVPALYFSRAMSTVLSLLGIYIGVVFLDAVIRWYVREVLPREKEAGLNGRILQVFRVGLVMVAVLAAVLIALDIWGMDSAAITNWLGEHGWRTALIIVLSLVLIIIVGEFVPRVVVTTLSRRAGETGVAYGEDLDRVISVINRVGNELAEDPQWAPDILKPPQALRVDNLGDSGIEVKILGDTKPIRQWDVMGELRRRLKKAFDQEGIEIPWPHTKVYFGNSPNSQHTGQKTG